MTFPMKAGDTIRLHITITDKDGTPLDLTETQIRWWASRGNTVKFSRTATLQKSLGNGIEEMDLMEGQFVVNLDPEDTRDLHGSYYHEVEIVDAFGNVSTPISNSFTVTKDLIR